MTNDELEARVAALEARDARRESEHSELLKAFATLTEERDRERHDNAETESLKWKWLDERIAGLRARPHADGDESTETIIETMQAVLALVRLHTSLRGRVEGLEAGRLSDLERGVKTIGIIDEHGVRLEQHLTMIDMLERRTAPRAA